MGYRITRAAEASDPDVVALSDNETNGLWARTGNGTGAGRTLTAGYGVTVANGSGVSGNPTPAVDPTIISRFVATNAALTALVTATGLVDNGIYCTYACTTKEDGGFGFWRYDSASTATANGNDCLAIDGGGAGRFFRLDAGVWADVASASTTNLASLPNVCQRVTGTTTITALGTAATGTLRVLRFEEALTLTYNATSLILPGAASHTTAANDCYIFRSLGSGNWICTSHSPGVTVATNSTTARRNADRFAYPRQIRDFYGATSANTNTQALTAAISGLGASNPQLVIGPGSYTFDSKTFAATSGTVCEYAIDASGAVITPTGSVATQFDVTAGEFTLSNAYFNDTAGLATVSLQMGKSAVTNWRQTAKGIRGSGLSGGTNTLIQINGGDTQRVFDVLDLNYGTTLKVADGGIGLFVDSIVKRGGKIGLDIDTAVGTGTAHCEGLVASRLELLPTASSSTGVWVKDGLWLSFHHSVSDTANASSGQGLLVDGTGSGKAVYGLNSTNDWWGGSPSDYAVRLSSVSYPTFIGSWAVGNNTANSTKGFSFNNVTGFKLIGCRSDFLSGAAFEAFSSSGVVDATCDLSVGGQPTEDSSCSILWLVDDPNSAPSTRSAASAYPNLPPATYTPTLAALSGSLTGGTINACTGRRNARGASAKIDFELDYVIGTGGGTAITCTLPATGKSGRDQLIWGKNYTTGADLFCAISSASTTVAIFSSAYAYPGAAGDRIVLKGSYLSNA